MSQAPRRWASAFTPLAVLFFMRECLAWRGFLSLPIVIITFIIGGKVRVRMRPHSLCMAQFSLQVVYLSLHGLFIVLSLGYMTAHMRTTSASLNGVYTSLSKPSILFISIKLKVGKVALLLGSSRLRLVRACSMRT